MLDEPASAHFEPDVPLRENHFDHLSAGTNVRRPGVPDLEREMGRVAPSRLVRSLPIPARTSNSAPSVSIFRKSGSARFADEGV